MGEYLDQIPEKIQEHIRQITRSTRLPDTEESVESVALGWLEKRKSFEDQVAELQMDKTDFLAKDDPRGVLVMTYSGSLLNIGPMVDTFRKVEYVSIGLRKDVPETAMKEDSELRDDITVDEEVFFKVGPIKNSSPVFTIAVFREDVSPEEQEEKLQGATQVLAADFIEVNKTHIKG